MLRDQDPLLGFRDEGERLEGAGVVGTGLAEDALELLEDCGLEVDVPSFVICGQGMQRNRWTEQLSFGNGKVMELKLIKHDEALKELKEF